MFCEPIEMAIGHSHDIKIKLQAKDKDAHPRSIVRCFPQPNLKMRLVELNEDEGTFVLERVDSSCEPRT